MPIRWSARQVSESLDELNKILDELEPLLQRLLDKASETSKLPNLPDYVQQPLGWLRQKTSDFYAGQKQRIERVRGYIPKDDLTREQAEFQKLLTFFNGDRDKAEVAVNLSAKPKREVAKEQTRMALATVPSASNPFPVTERELKIQAGYNPVGEAIEPDDDGWEQEEA